MFLSIVIPCYNEEGRLPITINKIREYLKEVEYESEIIIVVEQSADTTLQIARNFAATYSNIKCFENDKKYGKGYSVKKGVLSSIGEYVLFTDADSSTPICEIEKMLLYLTNGEYDCCIGDRVQLKKQPLYRIFMGFCFQYIRQAVTGITFRDTQCGFKAFNRKFANSVFEQMKINGFAFDVEMLMYAKKFGFKVRSVRVDWFDKENSTVNPILDPIRMFNDLFKIRRLSKKVKV